MYPSYYLFNKSHPYIKIDPSVGMSSAYGSSLGTKAAGENTYYLVSTYNGSYTYVYLYKFSLFGIVREIPLQAGATITLDKAATFNGETVPANAPYVTDSSGVLALTTTNVSGTIEEPAGDITVTDDSII
jgi:hypothetical protein